MYNKIQKTTFKELIELSAEVYDSDINFAELAHDMNNYNLIVFYVKDEDGEEILTYTVADEINKNKEDLASSVLSMIESTTSIKSIKGIMIDRNFVEFTIKTEAYFD